MTLEIINQTQVRVPHKYLTDFIKTIEQQLRRKAALSVEQSHKSLQLVFLSKPKAKKLNQQFRNKAYATDVLSFDSMDPDSLGELVFCPQVLKKQATEHGLSYRDELCYMVLHGLLHLLGYDHEVSEKQAKIMFQLQDEVFEKALDTLSRT